MWTLPVMRPCRSRLSSQGTPGSQVEGLLLNDQAIALSLEAVRQMASGLGQPTPVNWFVTAPSMSLLNPFTQIAGDGMGAGSGTWACATVASAAKASATRVLGRADTRMGR